MVRYLLFIPILLLLSCSDKQKKEEVIDLTGIAENLPREMNLFSKKEPVSLYLYYDKTEVNEMGDTLIGLKIRLRNNTKDTIVGIFDSCPNYDKFKVFPEGLLEFYSDIKCPVYTKAINRYFPPFSNTTYSFQLRKENKNKSTNKRKVRLGIEFYWGINGMTPEEVFQLYLHSATSINWNGTYWSNYIKLKDDHKHITEGSD